MATHHYLQTLLPLLSFLLVSASAAGSGQLTSFSTSNLAAGEYVLQGDVTILPRGEYLLTGLVAGGGLKQNSVGRVVWSEPILFSNATHVLNFETTLRFGIYPYESQPAEGITFFIAPVGTEIPEGSAGGNLGVFSPEVASNSNTFAVEFDSHYNPGTVEPTMPHIGIDFESPVSSNHTYLGSALISQEVTATIRYEHATRLTSVTVYTANQVFTVSYVRDLSTVLTPLAQIGVSASTGEDVSFQYLRFWEFRPITYVPIPRTTSFTYDFYGSQPTDLTYQSDAHFPSDSTFLRLTRTDSSGKPVRSTGRVLYSNPIQFWDAGAQVDFETTIKFIITPIDSNPADGFAFFIAPVGSDFKGTGGNLGVFPSSDGRNPSIFAVEFDTFINRGIDPNFRHVGIDIEYLRSVNVIDVGDAILWEEVTARINYQAASNLIVVQVRAGSRSFEVSHVFDLSSVLNQEIQVGLSASTGGAVAVHDVVSWHFSSTLVQTGGGAKIRQYV